MKLTLALSAGFLLGFSPTVSADFVGLYSEGWYGMNADGVNETIENGSDYCVIDIYAQFASSDANVLGVTASSGSMSGGHSFVHNNSGPGGSNNWRPELSVNDPADGSIPQIDSFVTIGGFPGASNVTMLGVGSGSTAGGGFSGDWFLGDLSSFQGQVNPVTQRTWLGRFVVLNTAGVRGTSLDFTMTVQFGFPFSPVSQEEGSGSWTIVPAPGVLAMLGLGVLGNRRRRS